MTNREIDQLPAAVGDLVGDGFAECEAVVTDIRAGRLQLRPVHSFSDEWEPQDPQQITVLTRRAERTQ